MTVPIDRATEWLEADGLGGFASGTTAGIRTRRYHALLCASTLPPAGRMVLVNGWEAWLETPRGIRIALSSQHYAGDARAGNGSDGVVHPDGAQRLVGFTAEPWPTWTYDVSQVSPHARVVQEVLAIHDAPAALVRWRLPGAPAGTTLVVRPLLSGRDYHATHHENPAFRFEAQVRGAVIRWQPYASVPAVLSVASGTYLHGPEWYRKFLYVEERARGLDCLEDLASPGTYRFDLGAAPGGEAWWLVSADLPSPLRADLASATASAASAASLGPRLLEAERTRRARFTTPLHRAADQFLVRRGGGRTVIAGYPWFGDWGRDTFIALRGLCLATGRLDEARAILREWAGLVDRGMLPNRFPDSGAAPELNSVDAALWYVITCDEYLRRRAVDRAAPPDDVRALEAAMRAIVDGFARGTRYRIGLDERDRLLAAGEPGVALTWMDAKANDWVVTPRVGKPVEIQALWLNALAIVARLSPEDEHRWRPLFDRGLASFAQRFWNAAGGHLHDVVDVDHVPDTIDDSFRPNQIFAVGGLPVTLVDAARARQVVDAVELRLLTPRGLRSLAPGHAAYCPRYDGDVWRRDGAYHQGTVWPWLLGPFVDAWLRVRGDTPEARRAAHAQFVAPLAAHLEEAGVGHVSEITDAEAPFTPRGCPFQAWSVGELLRLRSLQP